MPDSGRGLVARNGQMRYNRVSAVVVRGRYAKAVLSVPPGVFGYRCAHYQFLLPSAYFRNRRSLIPLLTWQEEPTWPCPPFEGTFVDGDQPGAVRDASSQDAKAVMVAQAEESLVAHSCARCCIAGSESNCNPDCNACALYWFLGRVCSRARPRGRKQFGYRTFLTLSHRKRPKREFEIL